MLYNMYETTDSMNSILDSSRASLLSSAQNTNIDLQPRSVCPSDYGYQARDTNQSVKIIQKKNLFKDETFDTYIDKDETKCFVKLDTVVKLKDSTKQLLELLNEIQTTSSKIRNRSNQQKENTDTTNEEPSSNATDEKDDCSMYKRLTRKCHCLNRQEYNDFMIHFNETTKYFTSTAGEIIKNVKIVKKFIYMGGEYAKNALTFLNEGFTNSTHSQTVEITQGCVHADICNVFDDDSIVIVLISWPCKYPNYGDADTQALTAQFLNKLAQLEEGRRYLNFNSKITSDIRKVIRTKTSDIEYETLHMLNSTLNLMHPPLTHSANVSYCKPTVVEGFGSKTVTALLQQRQQMTLEEVFTYLDLLHNLSNNDVGKQELRTLEPEILQLFKQLLYEYDNSEMNIVLTNILNNIVSASMVKPLDIPTTIVVADTSTEPIEMKNCAIQFPSMLNKKNSKSLYKSKITLDTIPNKFRQPSKLRGFSWDSKQNISKFSKDTAKTGIIVVPLEERNILRKPFY